MPIVNHRQNPLKDGCPTHEGMHPSSKVEKSGSLRNQKPPGSNLAGRGGSTSPRFLKVLRPVCYLPCKMGCKASTTPPGLSTGQAVNLPPITPALQKTTAEHQGAVLVRGLVCLSSLSQIVGVGYKSSSEQSQHVPGLHESVSYG